MADERPDHEPRDEPGDEPRDDAVAGLLAVEPLDDLSRRRLVSVALAAADADDHPTRRHRRGRDPWRVLAAAAALVAVVTIGVVTLALPGDEAPQVAGRRAPLEQTPQVGSSNSTNEGTNEGTTGEPTERSTDSAAEQRGSAAAAVPPSPVAADLGDFGELTADASRTRLFDAIAALGTDVPPLGLDDRGVAVGAVPCPVEGLSEATLVAGARGLLDGRPAVVVVDRRADGTLRVRAVAADPCEVRRLRP